MSTRLVVAIVALALIAVACGGAAATSTPMPTPNGNHCSNGNGHAARPHGHPDGDCHTSCCYGDGTCGDRYIASSNGHVSLSHGNHSSRAAYGHNCGAHGDLPRSDDHDTRADPDGHYFTHSYVNTTPLPCYGKPGLQ